MITLTESDTFSMFEQLGTFVAADAAEHGEVVAQNERYAALLHERQGGSRDGRVDRFAQTLHLPDKHKECQATAVAKASTGCQATESNIYDTFNALAEAEKQRLIDGWRGGGGGAGEGPEATADPTTPTGGGGADVGDEGDDGDVGHTPMFANVAQELEDGVGKLWTGDAAFGVGAGVEVKADAGMAAGESPADHDIAATTAVVVPAEHHAAFEKLKQSAGFTEKLRLTERLVVHSQYRDAQRTYRGQDEPPPPPPPSSPPPAAAAAAAAAGADGGPAVDTDQPGARMGSGAAEATNTATSVDAARVEAGRSTRPSIASAASSGGGPTAAAPEGGRAGAGAGATALTPTIADASAVAAGPPPPLKLGQPAEVAAAAEDDDGSTDAEEAIAASKPRLHTLWTYACAATRGRTVSCTSWNKKKRDIIAAGYGDFEFASKATGLACCWSLKNPEFPERMYELDCGVCSIDFSELRPNMLAVGLVDGTVAVFDVSLPQQTPIVTSRDQTHGWKHTQAAWAVRWARFGSQDQRDVDNESLVSGSSDGRILKGVMVPNKGVLMSDLMRIKRIHKPGHKSAQNSQSHAAGDVANTHCAVLRVLRMLGAGCCARGF
jgi:hypothetical protein